MISRADRQKIKNTAIDIDHNAAFGGKSKGNKHLIRVVKIARFLSHKLCADHDVVLVAAYLHDVALPTENDYDYGSNKKLVFEILSKSGISFDDNFISRVAEAAASHEGTSEPSTLEAQIVHDADVIEKTGILGIIRHTWKMTNHGKINPKSVTDGDIRMIIDHIKWRQSVLQTKIAKKIAKKNSVSVSKSTLRKIVPLISDLASKGVITEKIAKKIEPFLNKRQRDMLSHQLNLRYLILLKF